MVNCYAFKTFYFYIQERETENVRVTKALYFYSSMNEFIVLKYIEEKSKKYIKCI